MMLVVVRWHETGRNCKSKSMPLPDIRKNKKAFPKVENSCPIAHPFNCRA
jgi:hypothetical protein